MQDPVGDEVHEWLYEHQTRLRLAFEGARERLKVAAERRKDNYDRRVRNDPLEIGQLVWLRDHSAKGRHKIQDLWGPVVYRVMRAPQGGGPVYTIAPTDDETKVRQVHRSLLKAVAGAVTHAGGQPCSRSQNQPLSEGESFCDGDLFLLRPEGPVAGPASTAAGTQTTPRLLCHLPAVVSVQSEPARAPSTITVAAPSTCSTAPPASDPGAVEIRRSIRSTAGLHPNLHHLPRSVGGPASGAANLPGLKSNAVTVLFRPWS